MGYALPSLILHLLLASSVLGLLKESELNLHKFVNLDYLNYTNNLVPIASCRQLSKFGILLPRSAPRARALARAFCAPAL